VNIVKVVIPVMLATLVMGYVLIRFIDPVLAPPLFTGQNLITRNPSEVVGLTATVPVISSDQYDGLGVTRGSFYQVPAGKNLILVHIEGIPVKSAGAERIEIGYSDATVSNDVAAPAGYVAVYNTSVEVDGSGVEHDSIWAVVPSGKYPVVYLTGDGAIQVTGVLVNE
jgi:hypothetical protein